MKYLRLTFPYLGNKVLWILKFKLWLMFKLRDGDNDRIWDCICILQRSHMNFVGAQTRLQWTIWFSNESPFLGNQEMNNKKTSRMVKCKLRLIIKLRIGGWKCVTMFELLQQKIPGVLHEFKGIAEF